MLPVGNKNIIINEKFIIPFTNLVILQILF